MTSATDVSSEIEGFKRELGVELDRDLAAALGIDPSAIAAWKRRGSVPEKYRLRALRRRDESAAEGLKDRTVSPFGVDLREAYIFALVSLAAADLEENFGGKGEYGQLWAGFRLANFYEFLSRRFNHRQGEDAWRKQFEGLRDELKAANNPAVWIETRKA